MPNYTIAWPRSQAQQIVFDWRRMMPMLAAPMLINYLVRKLHPGGTLRGPPVRANSTQRVRYGSEESCELMN